MEDSFGSRMKLLEMAEAGRTLMPLLPVISRLDGRGFSTFTRKMQRPFDRRMSELMVATTAFLVKETAACTGYTQSDEITLAWYPQSYESNVFFAGRIQKMTSQLAALTTAYFNDRFGEYFTPAAFPRPGLATFDCRVWNVPNTVEGANCFLWREQDATKNSISMAARAYFSHKALMNKKGSEMQEMLFQRGVNWNDYPRFFRRGTFIQKKVVARPFEADELDRLPVNHQARPNPELTVQRTVYTTLDMPPFRRVLNRPEVIFLGANPEVATEAAA